VNIESSITTHSDILASKLLSDQSKLNSVTLQSTIHHKHNTNQPPITMSTLIYTAPTYVSEASRRASAVSKASRQETPRTSSVSSVSSIKNGVKYVARKLKEHERESQRAWEAFYGFPTEATRASRPSSSPRNDSNATASSTESTGSVKKAWTSVKSAAKAHHEAVNDAYVSFYGNPRAMQQKADQINLHTRAY